MDKDIKKKALMSLIKDVIAVDHELHLRLIDFMMKDVPDEIAQHVVDTTIDILLDDASEKIDAILS